MKRLTAFHYGGCVLVNFFTFLYPEATDWRFYLKGCTWSIAAIVSVVPGATAGGVLLRFVFVVLGFFCGRYFFRACPGCTPLLLSIK